MNLINHKKRNDLQRKESAKDPYEEFVFAEIMKMPNMKKFTDYYNKRTEINDLEDRLMEGLEEHDKEYVIAIYNILDEEIYNVSRYSFCLGDRYALSILKNTRIEKMNILCSKYI